MRLWPERMLKYLPNEILLPLHRDCCSIRGRLWGCNNESIQYVFRQAPYIFEAYHRKVIRILYERRIKIDLDWEQPGYRGSKRQPWNPEDLFEEDYIYKDTPPYPQGGFYEEQDQDFWEECRNFLLNKKDMVWIGRVPPKKQPKKTAWSKKHSRGCHLTACTSCDFSLITDEDEACPRCGAEIDKTAEPIAVLCLRTDTFQYKRERMSFEKLRLSNLRYTEDGDPYWRYVSLSDRMWYRRWLGRRMKREDMKAGPKAEDLLQLLLSTRDPVRASSFIPSNMKARERKRLWSLWKDSPEEGHPHRIKGRIRK